MTPGSKLRRALAGLRPAGAAAVVLMYHRVDVVEHDTWGLVVNPRRFEEQLASIRRLYRPLRLVDLAESVSSGRVPRKGVVLTFDDGYRDNLLVAKPLLERYEIPATVFVTTGYVDSGRDFWWDELGEICLAEEGLPEKGEIEANDLRLQWHAESRTELSWSLRDQLLHLSHEDRLQLLEKLYDLSGLPRPRDRKVLSANEVLDLSAGSLIDIGAHTVTHPSLPALARESQLSEMQASRKHLQSLLGQSVESFAYPYGDFAPETIDCARQSGFDCAVTVAADPVRAGADALALPRLYVRDWSRMELELKLAELFR